MSLIRQDLVRQAPPVDKAHSQCRVISGPKFVTEGLPAIFNEVFALPRAGPSIQKICYPVRVVLMLDLVLGHLERVVKHYILYAKVLYKFSKNFCMS